MDWMDEVPITVEMAGVMGERDHWRLGISRIAWDEAGAFRILAPSTLARRI